VKKRALFGILNQSDKEKYNIRNVAFKNRRRGKGETAELFSFFK
jgi:hypothetical protein